MRVVLFRAHEWLAERFRGVQYPRPQLIPKRAPPPFFANAMPWPMRFGLVVLGMVLIVGSLIVLAFIGLLVWATIVS